MDNDLTTYNTVSNFARTKTVATVGPASRSPEVLAELIKAGVDVFRLNMAHGTKDDHELAITNIRQVASELEVPVGILVDLAGPKIRLGKLLNEPMQLTNEEIVRFVRGTASKAPDELTCLYPTLIDEVKVGDAIVLADGIARLRVTEKTNDELTCVVIDGGKIRSRQGVNLPATSLSIPALGEVDIKKAIWAAEQNVDFVSLSFVSTADDINQLKSLLASHQSHALAIAKIEKAEALENLDAIVKASNGIMVARGDLGVEIDIEKTPGAQKRIIKCCLQYRKPVIVATQMLESMHTSKTPTRAEVTDVANAILDGADACMLSGETAIGQYPVHAVRMMNRIALETENSFRDGLSQVTAHQHNKDWDVFDAVVYGSAQIAKRVSAEMVVIVNTSTTAALMKSKQRDFIPVLCLTDDPKCYREMCLYWGIIPTLSEEPIEKVNIRSYVANWTQQYTDFPPGEMIVIVTDIEVIAGIHDSVLLTRTV
jgi:pyruvate kinase